jgi:hypothetical protein
VRDAQLRLGLSRVRCWTRRRLAAAGCLLIGLITVLITVIVTAVNAVTAQQAIALALSAGMTTLSGLLGTAIPDVWTAWRRGFRQGYQAAAAEVQPEGLGSDLPAKARRERGQTARLAEGRPTTRRLAAGNGALRPPNSANDQTGYP